MPDTTRPTTETVRKYLERRTHALLDPPPSAEEIWGHLGRDLRLKNHQPDGAEYYL